MLKNFVPPRQLAFIRKLEKGEEGAHFTERLERIQKIIDTMPATYETEEKKLVVTCFLHYFIGGTDFYIIEKDKGAPDDERPGQQTQAFGLVRLGAGYDPELGYINLDEVFQVGAELDLYFEPAPLGDIKRKLAAPPAPRIYPAPLVYAKA